MTYLVSQYKPGGLGTSWIQLTRFVLRHKVCHGGSTLSDDKVPISQNRDCVLGIEGKEIGGLGGSFQDVDIVEFVLQSKEVQSHMHGPCRRRWCESVNLKSTHDLYIFIFFLVE